MTTLNPTHLLGANWRSLTLGAFMLGATALPAQATVATDPYGYVVATVGGGSQSLPKLSFVSPALANPVEWQGQLTAVNGVTLTVANTDWDAGRWDSRHCLEVVSGPYAGFWVEVVSAEGDQLTVADPMDVLLDGDETVRIRRFTTLSDFLGSENEAGLKASGEIAFADVVSVYHAAGIKNYWYYDGGHGGNAGWVDANWNAAADAIIAPGEGVVVRRKDSAALSIYQTGAVKTGPQGIAIYAKQNIVGGIVPVDVKLGDSQLYTGSSEDGIEAGPEAMSADTIVIYADQPRTYWYYDGLDGGGAGWLDAAWNPADDVVIPGGSTFVLNRRHEGAFIWFLPSLID